jgi:hypothetical protein
MKISFELTDRDLRFFREALKQSRNAVRDAGEVEIIDAIRDVLEEIRQSEPLPDFVGERIPMLESLIAMLTDDEWQLPEIDRERLLATFVYFADPEDILPDDIPGLRTRAGQGNRPGHSPRPTGSSSATIASANATAFRPA